MDPDHFQRLNQLERVVQESLAVDGAGQYVVDCTSIIVAIRSIRTAEFEIPEGRVAVQPRQAGIYLGFFTRKSLVIIMDIERQKTSPPSGSNLGRKLDLPNLVTASPEYSCRSRSEATR